MREGGGQGGDHRRPSHAKWLQITLVKSCQKPAVTSEQDERSRVAVRRTFHRRRRCCCWSERQEVTRRGGWESCRHTRPKPCRWGAMYKMACQWSAAAKPLEYHAKTPAPPVTAELPMIGTCVKSRAWKR